MQKAGLLSLNAISGVVVPTFPCGLVSSIDNARFTVKVVSASVV